MQIEGLSREWGKVFLNGRLVDAGEAAVSAFDRGFLYGDGVFETLRVYSGVPFKLDSHLDRMARGCRTIRLKMPDPCEIKEGVRAVLEGNRLSDAYLRITVTRGATGLMWSDLACEEPTLMIIAKPYHPKDFGAGLKLVLSHLRTDEGNPLSGVKQTGISAKILARSEAVDSGADDALMLDMRGNVAEAASSNIFWVRNGRIYTPFLSCGILPGITRSTVIGIAQCRGLSILEGEFCLDELRAAEEVFLTSSTWELAPVLSLDGRDFPSPNGPVTMRVLDCYRSLVDEEISNSA